MEDAVDVYAGLTAIVALEGQIPVKYRGICHIQEHTSVAFEASAAIRNSCRVYGTYREVPNRHKKIYLIRNRTVSCECI